ncbi:hypothetical protein K0M31_004285 [Melipona bicolor]|uniref:Uncharacterized protein n=1 Tax=Melipona bicolor TaxID=60889 RepID=A0AA40FWH3_9HYME|nr:hypothetical protein K0M31_004285 [Melipona bicolor]
MWKLKVDFETSSNTLKFSYNSFRITTGELSRKLLKCGTKFFLQFIRCSVFEKIELSQVLSRSIFKAYFLGNDVLSEETWSHTFSTYSCASAEYQSVVHRWYIFALAMFEAYFVENDALSEKLCSTLIFVPD